MFIKLIFAFGILPLFSNTVLYFWFRYAWKIGLAENTGMFEWFVYWFLVIVFLSSVGTAGFLYPERPTITGLLSVIFVPMPLLWSAHSMKDGRVATAAVLLILGVFFAWCGALLNIFLTQRKNITYKNKK